MLMARMIVVDRDGKEHEVEGKSGLKIMEILRELDYGVAAICGGLCSCATCHVYVDADWVDRVGRPDAIEEGVLDLVERARPGHSRLSCQIILSPELDGLKVAVADNS